VTELKAKQLPQNGFNEERLAERNQSKGVREHGQTRQLWKYDAVVECVSV
jgi:hypothetical protein